MTISVAYVVLCAAGLPFWTVQQHLGGKSVPLIILSCIYIILSLFTGITIPMDSLTLTVGCLALWLSASLSWTNTQQSVFELFTMLSYFVLFLAARTVPMPITALAVFCGGMVFAALMVYRFIFQPHMQYFSKLAILGNSNHIGSVAMITLFTGIWLAINISPWFIPFIAVAALCLVMTKCRGAITSSAAALAAVLYMSGGPGSLQRLAAYSLAALCIIAAAAILYRLRQSKRWPEFARNIYTRIILYYAAAMMVVNRPITGWGFNAYRKMHPEVDKKIIKTRFGKYVMKRIHNHDGVNMSHRVHNDHLEFMAEAGITGYVLFAWLFAGIPYEPATLGLFVAVAIHALVFFPFREVHTAAPFWAMMGSAAPAVSAPFTLPLVASIALTALTIPVMLKAFNVFMGQNFYMMAVHTHDDEIPLKQKCVKTALYYDPLNGLYMADACLWHAKTDPVRAWYYADLCLNHYDGERVKAGICDQYARALLGAGEVKICHWAEDMALDLVHDFYAARVIKNYLRSRENGGPP
jgi:O-antigen ligase